MTSFNATRGRTILPSVVTRSSALGGGAPAPAANGALQVEECLAVAALAMEDWAAVAQHCEKLAAGMPDRFAVWLNLSAALIHMGRGEEAVAAATQAVSLEKDSAEAHLNLAFALHQAGQAEQGAHHYQHALKLGCAAPEAHWNLALLEASRDNVEAAVEHLSHVEANDAAWQRDVRCERGALLLAMDRAGEAVPLLEASVAADERDLQSRYNLGVALLRSGDAAHALEAFEGVRAEAGDDLELLWAVAAAASAAGDGKQLSLARRALRDHGESVTELTFHLALHLEAQGRDTDALRAYSEVLKERPLCAEALANLAQVLSRLGQEDQSQACWQRAVALKPELSAA